MLRKKRGQKGFTLIELLIVIAIIGILAAIAIPMYRTQTIKARMTEVTNAMSNVASAVASYYQDSSPNAFPTCATIAEVQNSLGVSLGALTRLGAIAVNNGAITATVANVDTSVDTKTLILTPTANADNSLSWAWTVGAGMPPAYLPRR